MRYPSLSIFCCLFLIVFSCSDGDVLTVEFDFEDTFEGCEESELLFYKTKENPSESLSLLFTSINYVDIFQRSEDSLRFIGDTIVFEEPAQFNYRTYNRESLPNDLFCSLIPPKDLNISIDEPSDVNVTITRVLTEDDNDGIPAALEGPINPLGDDDNDGVYNFLDDEPDNPSVKDENNQIEDGFDTDGDGLPNFIDDDDDGDNVLTKNENPDPNEDGDISDAQDTDEDGEPDYLDSDDDGDDVLTRDEENDTQDENPLNDITNSDIGPDFLNSNIITSVPASAYRQHKISLTFSIRTVVKDINISFLAQDVLDFGELSTTNTNTAADSLKINQTRTATPVFP